MFLHLGGDISVNEKNITAVMDLETTSVSKITKEYLSRAEKRKEVINISDADLPKSYVITVDPQGVRKVYISPISSATLMKRMKKI